MAAHSFFTVLRDGQAVVHSEMAEVNLLSTSVDAGPSDIACMFYYTAPLVPTFWSNICQDRGKLFSPPGSFLWTNHQPFRRSCPVFDYPRHLPAPRSGRGVIERPRTGLPDPFRRVPVHVPGLALLVSTALPHRVVEQRQQLVTLALVLQQRELPPSSAMYHAPDHGPPAV